MEDEDQKSKTSSFKINIVDRAVPANEAPVPATDSVPERETPPDVAAPIRPIPLRELFVDGSYLEDRIHKLPNPLGQADYRAVRVELDTFRTRLVNARKAVPETFRGDLDELMRILGKLEIDLSQMKSNSPKPKKRKETESERASEPGQQAAVSQ